MIVLDIVPTPFVSGINCVAELGGHVFCTTGNCALFSFDAETGTPLECNRDLAIRELLLSRNGTLYGISYSRLFQIDPDTLQAETLLDGGRRLSHLTEDPVTGALYVFDDTDLYRLWQE